MIWEKIGDFIYLRGSGNWWAIVVNRTFLEGSYSAIFQEISQDEAGIHKLFLLFSRPDCIPARLHQNGPGWFINAVNRVIG